MSRALLKTNGFLHLTLKNLVLLFTIVFLSCESSQDKKNVAEKEISNTNEKRLESVGEKVQGDFNGDKQLEFAIATQLTEQEGNPVEGGTAATYQLQFSNVNLPPVNVDCCDFRIINEGDLNNDGADDLSIFQAPVNGCSHYMTTYAFVNNNWQQIVKTFLVPTACEQLSNEELQKRIFREGNIIYYLDTDPNMEHGKLIKKQASFN
jgi:hypothetical protein